MQAVHVSDRRTHTHSRAHTLTAPGGTAPCSFIYFIFFFFQMSRVGGGRTHASSVGDCDVARAKGTEKFIQKGVKKESDLQSQTVNVKYFVCTYV